MYKGTENYNYKSISIL